jgi:hypothetical protein
VTKTYTFSISKKTDLAIALAGTRARDDATLAYPRAKARLYFGVANWDTNLLEDGTITGSPSTQVSVTLSQLEDYKWIWTVTGLEPGTYQLVLESNYRVDPDPLKKATGSWTRIDLGCTSPCAEPDFFPDPTDPTGKNCISSLSCPPDGTGTPRRWICQFSNGALRLPGDGEPTTYDFDALNTCCYFSGCYSHSCNRMADWGIIGGTGINPEAGTGLGYCPDQSRNKGYFHGSGWCAAKWACVSKTSSSNIAKYIPRNTSPNAILKPVSVSSGVSANEGCTMSPTWGYCDPNLANPSACWWEGDRVCTDPIHNPDPFTFSPTGTGATGKDANGKDCAPFNCGMTDVHALHTGSDCVHPKVIHPTRLYCSCAGTSVWDPNIGNCISLSSCKAGGRVDHDGQCECPTSDLFWNGTGCI